MTTKEELRKELLETSEEVLESLVQEIKTMAFKMKLELDKEGAKLIFEDIQDVCIDFFEHTTKEAIAKMKNKPKE
jgi:hypothetical protein